MAKKWIINDGRFLMSASVEFHSQLAKDHSTTKGGGLWHLKDNNLYLYGSSMDYGRVKLEDLVEIMQNDDITSMRVQGWNIFFSESMYLEDCMMKGLKIKNAVHICKEHTLRCLTPYFQTKWDNKKDWELRKNDRDYQVGDILIEEEGTIEHDDFVRTGRTIKEEVLYVLKDQPQFGLQTGYCIMSTKRLDKDAIDKDELKKVFADDLFIQNVCLSYRHDFGLLTETEKKYLRFEVEEIMRAIINNLNIKKNG